MGRESLRRRTGILAIPNFRRFYAGYVTSLLGSSMSTVAIAWAVLDDGGSATGLGLVFAANVVSQVLTLPFAGAIADRLGRRRVMLSADSLRCGAQASLAVALFAGRPPLWLFVLLAWLVGTGEAFFDPSQDALTVEIAPRDQLGNANALYGLARSATRIGGPVLGGVPGRPGRAGGSGSRGRGVLRGERARAQPADHARRHGGSRDAGRSGGRAPEPVA
jgi:MFS family permease